MARDIFRLVKELVFNNITQYKLCNNVSTIGRYVKENIAKLEFFFEITTILYHHVDHDCDDSVDVVSSTGYML